MLEGLWTIGIKVPDLERELEFQTRMGNEVVLDETLESGGKLFRLPLIRMGDKYLHLDEAMVYEQFLSQPLPHGIAHWCTAVLTSMPTWRPVCPAVLVK